MLKYFVLLLVALILLCLIYFGEIDRRERSVALKNSDSVISVITQIKPGKDQAIIDVKYLYKGTTMHCDFITTVDSFNVGDTILLKVARKYPEKYVEAIRIIKSK